MIIPASQKNSRISGQVQANSSADTQLQGFLTDIFVGAAVGAANASREKRGNDLPARWAAHITQGFALIKDTFVSLWTSVLELFSSLGDKIYTACLTLVTLARQFFEYFKKNPVEKEKFYKHTKDLVDPDSADHSVEKDDDEEVTESQVFEKVDSSFEYTLAWLSSLAARFELIETLDTKVLSLYDKFVKLTSGLATVERFNWKMKIKKFTNWIYRLVTGKELYEDCVKYSSMMHHYHEIRKLTTLTSTVTTIPAADCKLIMQHCSAFESACAYVLTIPEHASQANMLKRTVAALVRPFVSSYGTNAERVKPVTLILRGLAAVGKTTIQKHLVELIPKYVSRILEKSDNPEVVALWKSHSKASGCFTFNCSASEAPKFWEAYNGQLFIIFEEYQTSLLESTKSAWSDIFFSCINTAPLEVPKAFENKGEAFVNTPFVIATTNALASTIPLEDKTAMHRRVDFDILVTRNKKKNAKKAANFDPFTDSVFSVSKDWYRNYRGATGPHCLFEQFKIDPNRFHLKDLILMMVHLYVERLSCEATKIPLEIDESIVDNLLYNMPGSIALSTQLKHVAGNSALEIDDDLVFTLDTSKGKEKDSSSGSFSSTSSDDEITEIQGGANLPMYFNKCLVKVQDYPRAEPIMQDIHDNARGILNMFASIPDFKYVKVVITDDVMKQCNPYLEYALLWNNLNGHFIRNKKKTVSKRDAPYIYGTAKWVCAKCDLIIARTAHPTTRDLYNENKAEFGSILLREAYCQMTTLQRSLIRSKVPFKLAESKNLELRNIALIRKKSQWLAKRRKRNEARGKLRFVNKRNKYSAIHAEKAKIQMPTSKERTHENFEWGNPDDEDYEEMDEDDYLELAELLELSRDKKDYDVYENRYVVLDRDPRTRDQRTQEEDTEAQAFDVSRDGEYVYRHTVSRFNLWKRNLNEEQCAFHEVFNHQTLFAAILVWCKKYDDKGIILNSIMRAGEKIRLLNDRKSIMLARSLAGCFTLGDFVFTFFQVVRPETYIPDQPVSTILLNYILENICADDGCTSQGMVHILNTVEDPRPAYNLCLRMRDSGSIPLIQNVDQLMLDALEHHDYFKPPPINWKEVFVIVGATSLAAFVVSFISSFIMTMVGHITLSERIAALSDEEREQLFAQSFDPTKTPIQHTKVVNVVAKVEQQLQETTQQQSGQDDQIRQRVASNIYVFCDEVLGCVIGHLLFVHGSIAVVNNHVYESLPENFCIVPGNRLSANQGLHRLNKGKLSTLSIDADNDLRVISIPFQSRHKSLISHLLDEPQRGDISTGGILHFDDSTISVVFDPISDFVTRTRFNANSVNKNKPLYLDRVMGYSWEAAKASKCGSVVIGKVNNQIKIIGLHVSGASAQKRGFCVYLPKGTVAKYMNPDVETTLQCGEDIAFDDIPHDESYAFTDTHITAPVKNWPCNVTVFVPTAFKEEIFDDFDPGRPASLTKEAYNNALQKEKDAQVVLSPSEDVQRIYREFGEDIANLIFPLPYHHIGQCTTMSFDDAVFGSGEDKGFDLHTADGPRLRKMGFKKIHMQDKDSPVYTFVKDRVKTVIEKARTTNVWPYQINEDVLKDEIRDHERVDQKKTRIFNVTEFTDNVLIKMGVGQLATKIKKYIGFTPATCGINPTAGIWANGYNLFKDYPVVFSDIKGFDYTATLWLTMIICPWMRKFYHKRSEWLHACWAFIGTMQAIRFVNGTGRILNRGNTSGNWATTIFNTWTNTCYHGMACVYGSLKNGQDPKYNLSRLALWLYSDDNISSLQDGAGLWWNTTFVSSFFKNELKITITDTNKGEFNGSEETFSILDAEFLCRRFVPRNGQIYAPLAYDSMMTQLYYVRCPLNKVTPKFITQQLQQNLDNVMLELCEYEPEQAAIIVRKLREFISKHNLPLELKPKNYSREAILKISYS